MKALITGATGFIGYHVASFLTGHGTTVRALVRESSYTRDLEKLGIELFRGDIRDSVSVEKALRECNELYHIAADYRLWVPDPDPMYAINVLGTKTVMKAAHRLGTKRIVYTSTVGTLPTSTDGKAVDESCKAEIRDMVGHYKISKFLAEKEVFRFIEKGLPVVIVNPSTPVGPGDRRPTPTGQTILDFLNGMIPAYLDTGLNIVDVADVAAGHWLAARYGRIGQRYILGNRNMSLREFFDLLANITGRPRPRVRLPYLPVLVLAYVNETVSGFTGKPPRVPVTSVKMARKFMYFDCSRAARELKMPQSPVREALEKAVSWFSEHGYVKNRPV